MKSNTCWRKVCSVNNVDFVKNVNFVSKVNFVDLTHCSSSSVCARE